QSAALPLVNTGVVENAHAPDERQVAGARGLYLRQVVAIGRVPLGQNELAAVDAAGGVAPVDERVGAVEDGLQQSGRRRPSGVGDGAARDGGVGDAGIGRALGVTGTAYLAERAEGAGTSGGRCR